MNKKQLPPVGDNSGVNLLDTPDILLTEIMRQEEGNGIIQLSMLARNGKQIPYGNYNNDAYVLSKDELTEKLLLMPDQVICGKNDTRHIFNNHIRKLLGYTSKIPTKNDKLICTKNNWNEIIEDTPLINGLIGFVNNIDLNLIDWVGKRFRFDFKPDFTDEYFDNIFGDLTAFLNKQDILDELNTKNIFSKKIDDDKEDDLLFFNEEEYNNRLLQDLYNDLNDDLEREIYSFEDDRYKKKSEKFDFGYAITAHKSQGSEFPKVLVYAERMGNNDYYNKWLYTSVTRASKKLVLLK